MESTIADQQYTPTMSSTQFGFTSRRYKTAKEFIDNCAPSLIKTRPTHANLALASSYAAAKSDTPSTVEEWWISLSPESSSQSVHSADVLFTFTAMATWPGVLACSVDPKDLPAEYLKDAMKAMVHTANDANLSASRLTSICGPAALGNPFADAWAEAHQIMRKAKPIMHIYHSFVTKDTLRPAVQPKVDGVELGHVTEMEMESAAVLIVDFTRNSPHPISLENARKSMGKHVQGGELYRALVDGKMKAYVFITRPTPGVKAIAHVYTAPDARGKGLAEALVRHTVES
jgi:GNAT superfamily N-acetyltransferase